MEHHSHNEWCVEWLLLIDEAPNDLRWVHLDVKMAIASITWHNKDTIRDLEWTYQTNKGVEGLEFQLVKADKWACSYNTSRFVIFYGDIIDGLRINMHFTHFQVDVLNSINVCLSQFTWNMWAFIFYFVVICLNLKMDPMVDSFLFFFTHT